MDLKLESQQGFLLATFAGRVSFNEALELAKNVCDMAAERGFGNILADCLALEGELSVADRYELGEAMAEYCRRKSVTIRAAVIGKMPTITGFGAQVARNRGLVAMTFTEQQAGLDWLNKFPSRPPLRETSVEAGGQPVARKR